MQVTSKSRIKEKFAAHYLKSYSTSNAIKKTAIELGISEEIISKIALSNQENTTSKNHNIEQVAA